MMIGPMTHNPLGLMLLPSPICGIVMNPVVDELFGSTDVRRITFTDSVLT